MAEAKTVCQRATMPAELYRAAIEGNTQVLTEMLKLEENHSDQTTVTIEPSDGRNFLIQSATFMGNTVLHVLCSYGSDDRLATKVCKKDGSLLKARNKMLETPLHCAAKTGHVAMFFALVEFARGEGELTLKELLRSRNHHGETILHEAARHGSEEIIDQLMKVDPELAFETDDSGTSALLVAIARGDEHVVKSMSNKKLSGQQNAPKMYFPRPNEQYIALHTTLESAEASQKPKALSSPGSSPIHLAVSVDNSGAVEHLLDMDSSLAYLQDSDGLFPVHVAAQMGHHKLVLLFMQRFLDSGELLDHRGRNFLHIAAEENKPRVFGTLIENAHCLFLFWEKTLPTMINATDNEGNTPLHLASAKGCKSIMMAILEIRVASRSSHLRNKKGFRPFDVSVIQVKERMKNSPEIQDSIEEYFEKKGHNFDLHWFHKVMATSDAHDSSMTDQLQIIGLGAVLITTVAFAAAFTLPGGYDSNGSPLLASKYLFKAFILADTVAFILSFFCVLMLMMGGMSSICLPGRDVFLSIAMYFFSEAARSMVLAFGLGLYLVLSPVCKGVSILVVVIAGCSVMLDLTPTVLQSIINGINRIGYFMKDLRKFRRKNQWIVNLLKTVRFLLPFLMAFVFAFLP